jgi:3-phosphoshikimate 1-carboxyvinyltransferase
MIDRHIPESSGASATVRPLKGSIRVPGDKSLSHRIALFSAMAEGSSRVRGLLDSLDVRSTLAVIESLGARVELDVDGCAGEASGQLGATTGAQGGLSGTITGWGPAGPRLPERILQCGNSGTTARLLLGALSGYDITASLTGDESLCRRPMGRVTLPLSRMGARFAPLGTSGDAAATLPLTVYGSASPSALDYQSPVASAQVKSTVLLAGLNARGTTSVTEPYQSRDHTELLLPAYGVQLAVDGLTVSVTGGQRLRASDCEVAGDPSSAAFPLVAAALIPASEVTARGVLLNPTRTGFLAVMRRMGADMDIETGEAGRLGGERTGDVSLRYRGGLRATTVAACEVPSLIDEVPILALLATAAEGTTVFEGVGELRVKESDRLAAIVDGLTALGCVACAEGDELRVSHGLPRVDAPVLKTHGDHRLAMTWVIAARAFGLNPTILGLESVKVSYPTFFDDLEQLS